MQSQTKKIIYIDESGGVKIGTNKPSDLYIISAIVVDEDKKDDVEQTAKKNIGLPQGGELKSSKIKNYKRRNMLIQNILALDIYSYNLVIVKDRIYRNSGLAYSKSFYKYCHKMFYNKLNALYEHFHVVIDNYGDDEFKSEFLKYIQNQNYLFHSTEIINSKENFMIQLADIIAGSIRRYFIDHKNKDQNIALDAYPNKISVDFWPPYKHILHNDTALLNIEEKHESSIIKHCVGLVRKYIETNHDNEDHKVKSSVAALLYL